MEHEQTVRIIPGANTAVLFLHGICGSPNHFRALLPLEEKAPDHWSVYNIVLDGHCKTVEDFSHTSMKKWQRQVHAVFDELCQTHQKVILVGHSMGTLFSIQLALERPEKIAFVFLLAVPVRVRVRLAGIRNLLRIPFARLDENDPVQVSLGRACGIAHTPKLWKYIPWAHRIVELLQLCHAMGKRLSELRVPCIAWQSERDEMVSNRAGELLRKSGRVEVHDLPKSTHFYYDPVDTERVVESFLNNCSLFQ